MSSPIRPAKDANPALAYAPPWVRDRDPEAFRIFAPVGTVIVAGQWRRS